MTQQDLIGFFSSVPHSRICSALQLMLSRLQEHFGHTTDELTFQVDHKAGTKDLRIFKGQQSSAKISCIQHQSVAYSSCHRTDRFPVEVGLFQGGSGYLCMGSPLAPVLCAMVAAEQEYLTIHSEAPSQLHYADNRCFFLRRSELQTDWARLLFYGLPIELQYVPGEDLLGSITSTQQRTISMQQPANETVLIVLYVQQDPDQRLFQDSMPELSASEDTPGQFDWYGHRWRT